MDGKGIFKWASGRMYIGSWTNDLKHGIGKLVFKQGNEYQGQFQNDLREGYGYYKWPDNRRFKGWWHNNKQHGLGMYFSPESTNYKFGLWQMGKRIKWFSDAECDLIRAGNFQYILTFSLEHEEG